MNAVGQKTVSADAVVQDRDRSRRSIGLQAPCQHVRPAVVAVGGGAVSVRDRVAQRNDSGSLRGRGNVHAGDEVPVLDLLGIGQIGS